jgi:hypothetical protein
MIFLIGRFLHIRSDSRGNVFNLTMNFNDAIQTIPGKKYTFSFYSIINCGNSRCSRANDSIIIRIKDGDNGDFKNVYTIDNHTTDNQWYNYKVEYTATNEKTFVREI